MNPELYTVIKALHLIGIVLWAGGLLASMQLLAVHPRVDEHGRAAVIGSARKTALLMDIGAFVAIALGLYLALGTTPSAFKQGGWLHLKLTVVVGLLAAHVMTRIKIGKFRRGDTNPMAGFLYPGALVILAAIVAIAVIKPFMR